VLSKPPLQKKLVIDGGRSFLWFIRLVLRNLKPLPGAANRIVDVFLSFITTCRVPKIISMSSIQEARKDGSAAKTRQQVDKAVRWLEKRYFTEDARTKKRLNESAAHLVKA